uniref:BZIP domain-containing protein n=1 Tax=Hucho hucho TaxID=62062 RepID=A0A4W5KY85_9TELE
SSPYKVGVLYCPSPANPQSHLLHCSMSNILFSVWPSGILDPSLRAGSLPSLGPLAGISATTLTDQLKLAQDFRNLGAMLSPLHFLGRLGKRPLTAIKGEMDEDDERRRRRRDKNKVAAARCRNRKKERTDFLQRVSRLFFFTMAAVLYLYSGQAMQVKNSLERPKPRKKPREEPGCEG